MACFGYFEYQKRYDNLMDLILYYDIMHVPLIPTQIYTFFNRISKMHPVERRRNMSKTWQTFNVQHRNLKGYRSVPLKQFGISFRNVYT